MEHMEPVGRASTARRCRISLMSIGVASTVFVLLQLLLQICIEFLDITDLPIFYQTTIKYKLQDVDDIVLVWWTPFTGNTGSFIECGLVRCFITQDRQFQYHPNFKMFLFYASNIEIFDLPLPKNDHDVWSLLHEESPKNVPFLCHEKGLSLFNYTATFSRFSDVPLTLQYVPSIESVTDQHYLTPVAVKNELLKDLSPLVYVQSDCDTPLDRDKFVQELIKFVSVDSYGACVNNKELPSSMVDPMKSMNSEEFMHFVGRYKFTLAFENAVCEDYITEKLWRPLIVGSVPIYWGSPSVQDWLPNPNSAVLASNFSSPKELADYILKLNENDDEYLNFLTHKSGVITNKLFLSEMKSRLWGLPKGSDYHYIDHFECEMCLQAYDNANGNMKRKVASRKEYFCIKPKSTTHDESTINPWLHSWEYGKCEASVLKELVEGGNIFINETLFSLKVEFKFSNGLC